MQKRIAREENLFYEELLKKEINKNHESYGKKLLKDKSDDNLPLSQEGVHRKRKPKQALPIQAVALLECI